MGRSWSGFLPQNEIVKLEWHALELCKSEPAVAEAFGAQLRGQNPNETEESELEAEVRKVCCSVNSPAPPGTKPK